LTASAAWLMRTATRPEKLAARWAGAQPDSAEDTRAYLVATACSEPARLSAADRIVSAC
jgi:hypothetical protein